MLSRSSRWMRLLVALGILLGLALVLLHLRFPLPYVYTVMTDQGPDYDDFLQFPARTLEPSKHPVPLPVALDDRVAKTVS